MTENKHRGVIGVGYHSNVHMLHLLVATQSLANTLQEKGIDTTEKTKEEVEAILLGIEPQIDPVILASLHDQLGKHGLVMLELQEEKQMDIREALAQHERHKKFEVPDVAMYIPEELTCAGDYHDDHYQKQQEKLRRRHAHKKSGKISSKKKG